MSYNAIFHHDIGCNECWYIIELLSTTNFVSLLGSVGAFLVAFNGHHGACTIHSSLADQENWNFVVITATTLALIGNINFQILSTVCKHEI